MNFLTLISPNYFQRALSGEELILFSISAVSMIIVLLAYYQKVLKKYPQTISKEESKPIYQYKDLLLQESYSEVERLPLRNNISASTRIIAFVLIILVVATPLYQLFKFEHFV